MSQPPALSGLRMGCVSYLNSKPLVYTLDAEEIAFAIPARLAESFRAGQLDLALMPVFEILRLGGRPSVADDIAIACRGEVYSVFVASRTGFAESAEIYLDPASRSSAALLRVLLAEFYPGGPKLVESPDVPEEAARLLIGDPAIAFRQTHVDGWQYHDLGALWKHHTGLPFVFAAWAVGTGVKDAVEVGEALRAAKEQGLQLRREIANQEPEPEVAWEYLTEFIRYDLREEEKAALKLFSTLAHRHGLLPEATELAYV